MQNSSPPKARFLDASELAIAHALRAAIVRLPVKVTANAADVSDSTAKNWRAEATTPSAVKALKLGQRVTSIRAAILGVLNEGETVPPHYQQTISTLFNALLAIAPMGGPAGEMAQAALREFAGITPVRGVSVPAGLTFGGKVQFGQSIAF